MLRYILVIILILPVIMNLSACQGVDKNLNEDEKIIYTMIIDSVFDSTYQVININDSTHSLTRYTAKNTFSETLFGEEPGAWFKSFFKKKNCSVDEKLIERFIDNNRKKYFIAGDFKLPRYHKFVNYLSIYYYLRMKDNQKNKLTMEIRDEGKFGIISFSRAAFNDNHTKALIEVNIHRKRQKEIFFSTLKKVNGSWTFSSNCYMYGPFRIRESKND